VALHATRHRRLGVVALGSSSSPRAPSLLPLLSDGAQEGERFPGGGGLRSRWLRMDFIGGG
jgi:hypothetical protein